jgi:hypothetical protein
MKSTRSNRKALLFIFSVLFLYSAATFAQEQFRLRDYVNPEYKWQKLDISFGLGGNSQSDKNVFEAYGLDSKTVNSQLGSNFSASYYGTKNSASYQGSRWAGLSSDFSLSNSELSLTTFSDTIEKSWQGGVSVFGKTINRFYDKKKMFLETDLELQYSYNGNKIENSDEHWFNEFIVEEKGHSNSLYASLPLLVGIGRIEEVQDARLAVYILDDLLASSDLARKATAAETLAFAEFITKAKNQRFFDSRIRKIEEITAIDSFLTVTGLKAESDASYYTLINDDWDYANGPVRANGSRFSFGAIPEIRVSYQFLGQTREEWEGPSSSGHFATNDWLDETHEIKPALVFISEYTFEKPSNLYWQHSFSARVIYSLNYGNYSFEMYKNGNSVNYYSLQANTPALDVGASYTLGFYPNSRTNFTLGVGSGYTRQWGNKTFNERGFDIIPEIDMGNLILENELSLNCYYYISPQLRFSLLIMGNYYYSNGNASLLSEWTGNKIQNRLNALISASFVYSIF